MKRFTKEKSPWVKTQAKTGTKKKKSGEFGDEKKNILADSDKGEEKPGDEHCSTSSESVVGISRKKMMGTNLPEERNVIREPLPSTSQDYSSPEISCNSRVPPCNRTSALAPRFPFFSSKIALFLFSLLMTTSQKRACRKRDQNYSFPAKFLFA